MSNKQTSLIEQFENIINTTEYLITLKQILKVIENKN